ncbi:hypothetical protein C8J57DRAFT_1229572 [Mycena rebaudengoi]|nr:hypothetical protein C8J57DRAFT_1229572 [Mycena rebaudengoi]
MYSAIAEDEEKIIQTPPCSMWGSSLCLSPPSSHLDSLVFSLLPRPIKTIEAQPLYGLPLAQLTMVVDEMDTDMNNDAPKSWIRPPVALLNVACLASALTSPLKHVTMFLLPLRTSSKCVWLQETMDLYTFIWPSASDGVRPFVY